MGNNVGGSEGNRVGEDVDGCGVGKRVNAFEGGEVISRDEGGFVSLGDGRLAGGDCVGETVGRRIEGTCVCDNVVGCNVSKPVGVGRPEGEVDGVCVGGELDNEVGAAVGLGVGDSVGLRVGCNVIG